MLEIIKNMVLGLLLSLGAGIVFGCFYLLMNYIVQKVFPDE